jgi:hypothetical protein
MAISSRPTRSGKHGSASRSGRVLSIRHGLFTSVRELVAAIGAFIGYWNDHPVPFASLEAPEPPSYIAVNTSLLIERNVYGK